MPPFLGVAHLTLRELWARKVILGLAGVSTLVLLSIAFALNLEIVDGTLASIRLFGTAEGASITLDELVTGVQSVVAGISYWLTILLALFASAPLFTTLLDDGHVALLLSKPMSRTHVLGGHLLAVCGSMLVLIAYLLGGVWLLLALKTGVWMPSFLLSIVVVAAMFAVMYAVVVLVGILSQSTALALIMTYALIVASLVLMGLMQILPQLSAFNRALVVGLNTLIPSFAEVTSMVVRLARSAGPERWTPFGSSVAVGVLLYVGAFWLFQRRDF